MVARYDHRGYVSLHLSPHKTENREEGDASNLVMSKSPQAALTLVRTPFSQSKQRIYMSTLVTRK